MIIKNKVVLVYDIEVFPNVFSCTIKNSETLEAYVYEISNRTNALNTALNLVALFKNKDYMFCGYNNIHYDNPIMNFIIENYRTIPNDYLKICKSLFNLSQTIITSESPKSWKHWKYANYFETLDLLTMRFSQKLRVGLKEMQVTMQYPNVQEYEGDFDKWLPDDEIDTMLAYNLNDVDSTLELLNRSKADIDLRLGIESEYGINALSKDGMTIGVEILKTKYLEATHKTWWDIKDLRSPCDMINLNDVIFPNIKFETPILQKVLDEMRQQTVNPGRKGYEKHFLLDGVEVTIGVGGIHTKNDPEAIVPKDNELLLDSDVNSLYPSLIISYGLVPPHLGKEFLQIYSDIRTERLNAKRNHEKIKNETLKLALNGTTGNYQNEHSWLYSPTTVMKIRINGQLLLLMLTEKLLKVGAKLKQLNTDGILYIIPKSVDYQNVLKEWELASKLTLETEEYEAFYQYAINDYLAVGIGYAKTKDKSLLKKKGLFIDKVSLGKGMQPLIIPKAINAFFADGIPIEKTIKESKDINDFITYQKVDKNFKVEYNDKLITRINRYYVSTGGYYLYRCTIDKDGKRENYANLLKSSGVIIVNDLSKIKTFPTDINYLYYIKECNKIISPFVNKQLTLFEDC